MRKESVEQILCEEEILVAAPNTVSRDIGALVPTHTIVIKATTLLKLLLSIQASDHA